MKLISLLWTKDLLEQFYNHPNWMLIESKPTGQLRRTADMLTDIIGSDDAVDIAQRIIDTITNNVDAARSRGKYVKWIIKQITVGNLNINDIEKAGEMIGKYHDAKEHNRIKGREKNIERIDWDDLRNIITKFAGLPTKSALKKEISMSLETIPTLDEAGVDMVYNKQPWVVFRLSTPEAVVRHSVPGVCTNTSFEKQTLTLRGEPPPSDERIYTSAMGNATRLLSGGPCYIFYKHGKKVAQANNDFSDFRRPWNRFIDPSDNDAMELASIIVEADLAGDYSFLINGGYIVDPESMRVRIGKDAANNFANVANRMANDGDYLMLMVMAFANRTRLARLDELVDRGVDDRHGSIENYRQALGV